MAGPSRHPSSPSSRHPAQLFSPLETGWPIRPISRPCRPVSRCGPKKQNISRWLGLARLAGLSCRSRIEELIRACHHHIRTPAI